MLKLFVWLFGKHHLFLLKAPSKFRYNSAFCFLKALSDVFIQRAEDRRRQQANQRPVSRSWDHSQPIRGQYPGHGITFSQLETRYYNIKF